MRSETSPGQLVFGDFCLDMGRATLLQGASPVSLTPKAFSVLEYLAHHSGRLVTKDEFMDRLWPGVFVGDAALKVCVREIRRALGDDSQQPRYVETAHRRGYRFIAPVTVVTSPTADAPLVSTAARANDDRIDIPATRYARSGDVNIAYQVIGDGPIDLVFVMGWVSHLDYFWREPSFARFLKRLASFSRLILFDKRGTGLSDRVVELPTLEQRMDDVRAVLDAVGSRSAALLGVSEGGPMCALFAATYPEKAEALVMVGSYAKRVQSDDYPWGTTREEREAFGDEIVRGWGGPVGIETRAPGRATDPEFRRWWASYLRMGADIDVRHVLPTVRVPTLVLHRTHDRCLRVEEGRYVASLVPGARMVELPGDDHLPFVGDQDALVDEIEAFLRGMRERPQADTALATVLCVRLVGEPPHAATAADFEAFVAREVQWFRGRAKGPTADGTFAIFDGPARAIRCAASLAEIAARLGLRFQAGLHTGECALEDPDATGPVFSVGRELAAAAAPGEVRVSRTVVDLVAGSGLRFEPRGVVHVGEYSWPVLALVSDDTDDA
jgi:DNA-binding winged helix-turn-helix (wHTH) protein/pimeloyl-ACP methyl ester carboxylesterase